MKFEVTYSDRLEFEGSSEGKDGLKIKGTAFRVGKVANKRVIIPSDARDDIANTLRESPILTDHSKSVRDLVGRVDESWGEGDLVKFKGTIKDETIEDKIVKGLISKLSVGLQVEDWEEVEENGEIWRLLKGVKARELSLVVFPAIASATFTPSFEFAEIEDINDNSVEQLTDADWGLMKMLFESRGWIVLSRPDLEALEAQLTSIKENYIRMEKTIWLFSNCDPNFVEEMLPKIDNFDESQLSFLYETYKDLKSRTGTGAQGFAYEEGEISSESPKEDLRELIFGVRRDKRAKRGIRDLRDIKL